MHADLLARRPVRARYAADTDPDRRDQGRPPPETRVEPLLEGHFVSVVRPGHPLARAGR